MPVAGCGWDFLVPVLWLWLGRSGAGAVLMARAGMCGCILFGAFSCECRAHGWGPVVHAFMMSHTNVCMACSVACLLVYARMAVCMQRCMVAK